MKLATPTFSYEVGEIDYDTFHHTPEEYQNYVIRILSMQAYAERLGADEMGAQLRIAPDYLSKMRLAKIVYEESRHAYLLYNILDKIGVSEGEAVKIANGNTQHGQSTTSLDGAEDVGNSSNEWIDLILNNMLMDRAGGHMVSNFAQSSFRPWSEACKEIYKDEQWHQRFGLTEFDNYVAKNGTEDLSFPFSKWFVHAMNFFGPPSVNTQAKLGAYGLKRLSNQQLRQNFIDDVTQLLEQRNLQHLVRAEINYQYPCHLGEKS